MKKKKETLAPSPEPLKNREKKSFVEKREDPAGGPALVNAPHLPHNTKKKKKGLGNYLPERKKPGDRPHEPEQKGAKKHHRPEALNQ